MVCHYDVQSDTATHSSIAGASPPEVLKWFSNLASPMRVEFVCCLLQLCDPCELRFYGSCLEDIARQSYTVLQDMELQANYPMETNGIVTSWHNTVETVKQLPYAPFDSVNLPPPFKVLINDPNLRYKIIVCLSLLKSTNITGASSYFDAMMADDKHDSSFSNDFEKVNGHPALNSPDTNHGAPLISTDDNAEDPFSKVLASIEPQVVEELLLVYTLAAYHPAFSFDQRRRLYSRSIILRHEFDRCNKKFIPTFNSQSNFVLTREQITNRSRMNPNPSSSVRLSSSPQNPTCSLGSCITDVSPSVSVFQPPKHCFFHADHSSLTKEYADALPQNEHPCQPMICHSSRCVYRDSVLKRLRRYSLPSEYDRTGQRRNLIICSQLHSNQNVSHPLVTDTTDGSSITSAHTESSVDRTKPSLANLPARLGQSHESTSGTTATNTTSEHPNSSSDISRCRHLGCCCCCGSCHSDCRRLPINPGLHNHHHHHTNHVNCIQEVHRWLNHPNPAGGYMPSMSSYLTGHIESKLPDKPSSSGLGSHCDLCMKPGELIAVKTSSEIGESLDDSSSNPTRTLTSADQFGMIRDLTQTRMELSFDEGNDSEDRRPAGTTATLPDSRFRPISAKAQKSVGAEYCRIVSRRHSSGSSPISTPPSEESGSETTTTTALRTSSHLNYWEVKCSAISAAAAPTSEEQLNSKLLIRPLQATLQTTSVANARHRRAPRTDGPKSKKSDHAAAKSKTTTVSSLHLPIVSSNPTLSADMKQACSSLATQTKLSHVCCCSSSELDQPNGSHTSKCPVHVEQKLTKEGDKIQELTKEASSSNEPDNSSANDHPPGQMEPSLSNPDPSLTTSGNVSSSTNPENSSISAPSPIPPSSLPSFCRSGSPNTDTSVTYRSVPSQHHHPWVANPCLNPAFYSPYFLLPSSMDPQSHSFNRLPTIYQWTAGHPYDTSSTNPAVAAVVPPFYPDYVLPDTRPTSDRPKQTSDTAHAQDQDSDNEQDSNEPDKTLIGALENDSDKSSSMAQPTVTLIGSLGQTTNFAPSFVFSPTPLYHAGCVDWLRSGLMAINLGAHTPLGQPPRMVPPTSSGLKFKPATTTSIPNSSISDPVLNGFKSECEASSSNHLVQDVSSATIASTSNNVCHSAKTASTQPVSWTGGSVSQSNGFKSAPSRHLPSCRPTASTSLPLISSSGRSLSTTNGSFDNDQTNVLLSGGDGVQCNPTWSSQGACTNPRSVRPDSGLTATSQSTHSYHPRPHIPMTLHGALNPRGFVQPPLPNSLFYTQHPSQNPLGFTLVSGPYPAGPAVVSSQAAPALNPSPHLSTLSAAPNPNMHFTYNQPPPQAFTLLPNSTPSAPQTSATTLATTPSTVRSDGIVGQSSPTSCSSSTSSSAIINGGGTALNPVTYPNSFVIPNPNGSAFLTSPVQLHHFPLVHNFVFQHSFPPNYPPPSGPSGSATSQTVAPPPPPTGLNHPSAFGPNVHLPPAIPHWSVTNGPRVVSCYTCGLPGHKAHACPSKWSAHNGSEAPSFSLNYGPSK